MSVGIEGQDGISHDVLESTEGLGRGKVVAIDGFLGAEGRVGDEGCRDEIALDGLEELLGVLGVETFQFCELFFGVHNWLFFFFY